MLSISLRTATALAATTAALLALPGDAARADCQPDPAASGQTVVCTGPDGNGFTAGGGVNALAVQVLSGAAVTGSPNALTLNGANTVTIAAGASLAASSIGIAATGNDNRIDNAGVVAANGSPLTVVATGGTTTLTNSGRLLGVAGPASITGGAIVLANSGTIFGGSGGIVLAGGPDQPIVAGNSGLIDGGSGVGLGVEGDGLATISITNSGVIRGVAGSVNALGFLVGGMTQAIPPQGSLLNTGTLDGALTTSGVTVTNSGTITVTAPGTGAVHQIAAIGLVSISSPLVTAGFVQTPGGLLALRVDAAGGADRLLVTDGTAQLGGTLQARVEPGLYGPVTTYANVVSATGGFAGTQFAAVTASSPFFVAGASYTTVVPTGITPSTPLPTSAVTLTLTRLPFGGVPGETDNQRAVGNALEGFYSTGLTGNAATLYAQLLASTSVTVLDSLSGEIGTGGQTPSFVMGEQFFGAMLAQLQRWRTDAPGGPPSGVADGGTRIQLAAASPTLELAQAAAAAAPGWPPRSIGPRWAVWGAGFGLSGNRSGDGTVGSAALGYTSGGGAFGADVQLAPNLLLGASVGAAGSSYSLDGRTASGDVRTVFFGLYGSWTMGALYVDAAASYGHGQFSTTRNVILGGIGERATGEYGGDQYGGRIEAGWRFMAGRYALTPFAGLTAQALSQGAYTETSTNTATNAPGILGLSYQGETTTSVRTSLGGQVATAWRLGETVTLGARLRAAWAHEFNADRAVGAAFLTIPGAAFTVNGARAARDAALVSAGVDLGIGRNATLFAQFDGDLSGSGNAYAGTAGLRLSW